MTRKRTIGTMAAFGGITAAVALLSGLPAAKADELSDLRANQELLQQRLDQLAQAQNVGAGSYMAPTTGGPTTVQMMGGSFPRSFLIPGTDTSIRVGGRISLDADYWFDGGNPNASPQSTTVGDNGQLLGIPLRIHPSPTGVFPPGTSAATGSARPRGNSVFIMSPRESKLNFETRTPTAWGEARTFVEFDFVGSTAFSPGGANPVSVSDNLVPRLRFAYGTLGGILAGQANSNFSDPDANAETIDFGGNVGEPGVVRIPQVRYTQPLAAWGLPGAFSVSAETPETDGSTAAGQIASDGSPISIAPAAPFFNPFKSPAPDLTAAWYIPQPWGHMDFSAVLRPALQIKDGFGVDRIYTGYGLHFGGDVKPGWLGWAKDDINFQAVFGQAIGRYLNCSCSIAVATNYPSAASAGAATSLLAKPTVSYGGELGYKHFWLDNLRSTASVGLFHQDVDSRILTVAERNTFQKELITAHVNLIWNPVPFVDLGIEYMWGHRLVVSNLKGDENVVLTRMGVNF